MNAAHFKLSKYIIPTVIAMVLVGTYTNIDGLFIGNTAGDDGLAAINIAWPVVALITSLGTGIGVGGAVQINALRGRGRTEEAERSKFTALVLLFLSGIVIGGLSFVLHAPLFRLMGAEGQVFAYACDYAAVIAGGAMFQVVGAGIVVLLRSDGKTVQSMVCTFIGLGLHILFDILLVKRFVLSGVAYSTVLAQAAVMAVGLVCLRPARTPLFAGGRILLHAAAPFGVNFVSSVTLLLTNAFAIRIGGTAAVSAYAVMSYVVYTYDYVFQGVCDGVQPILSYAVGAEDKEEETHTVRAAVLLLLGFSLLFALLTPGAIVLLPKIIAVSPDAAELLSAGLWIYACSYGFKAMVKWLCAYTYSVGKLWIANALTYLDPLVLTPLCLFVLTGWLGLPGLWVSLPASQLLACAAGLLLLAIDRRKLKKHR